MSAAPRKRLWRWMAWGAGGFALLLGLLAVFAAWVVLTESGFRFAARTVEGFSDGAVTIREPAGRLGRLRIGELRVETADLRLRVASLALDWRPAALLDRQIEIAHLAATEVELSTRPQDEPSPAAPPSSLELPFAVAVNALRLDRLRILVWAPVPDPLGTASFELSALEGRFRSDGRRHRLESLTAVLPHGRASATGELDGRSPFALAARGTLEGERDGHAYALGFVADGDLLAPHVTLEAEGAGLSGDAELIAAPFERVPLRSLRAALGELDPSVFQAGAPRAALRIEADLRAESADPWVLAGPVTLTNARPDTADRNGLPFERLAARLRWTPSETRAEELQVNLPGGGRISGTLEWQAPRAPDTFGRLTAALALAGVDVRRLDARLPSAVLAGRLSAEADAARQSAVIDLRLGKARLAARGSVDAPAAPDDPRSFSAQGELAAFDPKALIADAPAAEINLSFDTSGRLAERPDLRLAWRFGPSRFQGHPLAGAGRVAVAGERLADAEVDITLAGNRLVARGAWGGAGDALEFDLDAPALGAFHEGLAGRARLTGRVGGTVSEPSGTARLYAEGLGLPGGVRASGINAEAHVEAGLHGPVELALGVTGVGRAGEPLWAETAALTVSGRRDDHRIELTARTPEADSLAASLEGALIPATGAEPLRWAGRLLALETGGRFAARLTAPADLTLSAAHVELGSALIDAGAKGRVRLDETLWTPERAAARGSLSGLAFGLVARPDGRPRRGPGPLVLGATWDLRLAQTAEGELRVFRESGDLTVTGEIPARLGLEHLEARLTARESRLALSVAARGSEMGELSGAATALARRGADGTWDLARDAPLLGSARLKMPSIAWLGRLMQENIQTDGSLQATFAISGTPDEPDASGRIEGRALALVLADQGLSLSGGELVADFDRDRLRLARLEFVSPNRVRPNDPRVPVARFTREPGRLTASGEIALDTGDGDFRFRADRLPLLQRPDRWAIISGEGRADSSWTSLDVTADMRLDAGYIELAETAPPALSSDVVILGTDEPKAGGFAVTAAVGVSLGDHLYLSGLGVDTRLSGALNLRLAEGRPLTAVGTVSTAGGLYRGYGQNLTIERGVVNFQGPLDNPGLNVVALRKGLAVEAGISITGSARRPQIRLISQPDVPDPEKLSWIVLGRPPSAGGGADLGLLLPAARALLGGSSGGGGGMTEQLSRSLGFDELSIGQGELGSVTRRPTSRVLGEGSAVTGEGTVSGQVLTLGKRLSSNLFLSFEQSLGGAESLVKLTYQLTRQLAFVVRSGTNNAADLQYTISFE